MNNNNKLRQVGHAVRRDEANSMSVVMKINKEDKRRKRKPKEI